MKKTHFKPNLYVGSLELLRQQNLLNKNIIDFYEPFIVEYGLIVGQDYNQLLSGEFKVTKADNYSINIAPGNAIVKDTHNQPARINIQTQQTIVMPQVDGVYKVLLKHIYTNYEDGSISINNGSSIVSGVNTKFTEVFEINRLLIFDNEYYTILQVNSDTELIITENFPGVSFSSKKYSAGGWFTTPRVVANDNQIYEHDSKMIVITTDEKGEDDEYWLAQVTITGGIITNVEDKRELNIFKLYSDTPRFDWQTARERKLVIYSPMFNNAGTVNADISTLEPQIKADDSHVGTFQSKLAVRFKKNIDDKELVINFSPTYTDTGLQLSELDAVKYQVRIDIDGQPEGTVYFLNVNEAIYDIENLPEGYYTLYFKLKKVSSAFPLSIMVNEISLKGNLNIVIEG